MRNYVWAFLAVFLLLPAFAFASPMTWTKNDLPFTLAEKIKEHDITVWQDSKDPNIINITSKHIRMQCKSLTSEFTDKLDNFDKLSNAELIDKLTTARNNKGKDDDVSYGMKMETLIEKAKEKGYYGSEQHVVCSIVASARTGFRIAPEFFLEADAFGGTAGNGPIIEEDGWIGQKKSTIAMAHDPDWILGRYFEKGPLKSLKKMKPSKSYQYKRIGCFGLLNGATAQSQFNTGIVNPFSQEHKENEKIAKELDRLHLPAFNYTDFFVLRSQQHGWMTYFSKKFMTGDWKNVGVDVSGRYLWNGKAPAGAKVINIFKLPSLRYS